MEMSKIKIAITIIASIILAMIVIAGAIDAVNSKKKSIAPFATISLEYVEVDGMTCIMSSGYKKAALSCDWAEWQGKGEN